MARQSVGELIGTSDSQSYLLIAVVAVAGYVIYQAIQGLKQLPKAAQNLTQPIATALANAWLAMQPASGISLLGNVVFPDGSKVPLSKLTVKQDTLGNVYVASPQNGLLLQLQPSNANGDWPAIQITDPSQIGTSMSNSTSDPSTDFGVTNTQGW